MKQSIALACFPEISIYSISKALILLLWHERKKEAEKIFDIICEPVDGGAAKGVCLLTVTGVSSVLQVGSLFFGGLIQLLQDQKPHILQRYIT